MDDDALMRELAEASEARSLDEQVAELAATVADLSKRVAAKERKTKLKVWHWLDATDAERAAWVAEAKEWYGRLQEREPRLADRLLPCWEHHPEVHWPICQLYQQYQKAFTHRQHADNDAEGVEVAQDDADMGGWWFVKWWAAYSTLVQTLKASCGEECYKARQQLAERRLGVPRDAFLDAPATSPGWEVDSSPVPSPQSRGDGWGLGGL